MRCLDSIPVSEEIQVIVVDDCSPDADTYKDRFPALSRPYLEMYSTPGSGDAGRARNIGIEHARGRWITFMDADDLFEDLAGIVADYLDRPEDVLFFKTKGVMSDDLTQPCATRDTFCGSNRAIEKGEDFFIRYRFLPLWGKFVKRGFIEEHRMRCNNARYCNDGYLSAQIGVYAGSVALIDRVAYILTERAGSLTSGLCTTWEEFSIRLRSAVLIQEFFDEHIQGYAGDLYATWLIVPQWKTNKGRYFRALKMLTWHQRWRVVKAHFNIRKNDIMRKLRKN